MKEFAEKLDITVWERSFRNTGVKVKSGSCKIRGKEHFIMDMRLPVRRKNSILASHLSGIPREDIYIVPAVRDFLDKHSEK